jgi:hypothetical protein
MFEEEQLKEQCEANGYTLEQVNKFFSKVVAIQDNSKGIIMLVDYPNYMDGDDFNPNVVCVDYEDTYMVDNTVSERNTHRIYLKDVLAKPDTYILYTWEQIKL